MLSMGAYHFWMAHMYNRVADFPAAHRHADASIAAAESAGDTVTLGKVLTQKSFTAYAEGSPAEGAELGRRAAAVPSRTAQAARRHPWRKRVWYSSQGLRAHIRIPVRLGHEDALRILQH